MNRTIGVLLFVLLGGCTSDTGSRDVALTADAKQITESSRSDGKRADANRDKSVTGGDRSAGEGTAQTCMPGGTPCSGNLTCQCCGSIGPKAICLCSMHCSSDGECQGTGLPKCNKPDPLTPGICTPNGFNCCWQCQ